jgi:hypothetical protein
VQGLDDGQTVTDLVTVRSLDGTAKIITITVNGQNEVETNEKSKFDQVKVEEQGPLFRYLSGKATDKEGVAKLIVSPDNGDPDKEYTDGIITGKVFYPTGTTVVLTATDKTGAVTTETRVM